MKTTLLTVLLLLSLGESIQAQSDNPPIVRRNIVKINPLSLIVADVSAFYERVLTKRLSLVGGFGYGSESFFYSRTPGPAKFYYNRFTLEQRYYFSQEHQAPVGFYAGVYARFARLTLDDYFADKGIPIQDQNGMFVITHKELQVLSPGALGGIQFVRGHLAVDAFLGLQYQLPTSTPPLRSVLPELMSRQGLTPRLGLTAGYAF